MINHRLKFRLRVCRHKICKAPNLVNDTGFEPDYCLQQIRSNIITAQRYKILLTCKKKYLFFLIFFGFLGTVGTMGTND